MSIERWQNQAAAEQDISEMAYEHYEPRLWSFDYRKELKEEDLEKIEMMIKEEAYSTHPIEGRDKIGQAMYHAMLLKMMYPHRPLNKDVDTIFDYEFRQSNIIDKSTWGRDDLLDLAIPLLVLRPDMSEWMENEVAHLKPILSRQLDETRMGIDKFTKLAFQSWLYGRGWNGAPMAEHYTRTIAGFEWDWRNISEKGNQATEWRFFGMRKLSGGPETPEFLSNYIENGEYDIFVHRDKIGPKYALESAFWFSIITAKQVSLGQNYELQLQFGPREAEDAALPERRKF